MRINKSTSSTHPENHSRPTFERSIDAYKRKEKLSEPTTCPSCGAVFHGGRWQLSEAPVKANVEICPACHRIKDNFPAGIITLEGDFFNTHLEEIEKLIQHHTEHEGIEHPLKRIIATEKKEGVTVITTTDTHLARGIGDALHHAYQGDLKIDHIAGENLVRVYWKR